MIRSIIAALAILLPLTSAGVSQEKKPPEELTVQGRWRSGNFESRVGYAPWVVREQDLLEQLQKAGAVPETKISLLLPRSTPREPIARLEAFLRENKFKDVGQDGVVVVTTPAKPGKVAPKPKAPTPLRIEISHAASNCEGFAKNPICAIAGHWSIRVDKTRVEGRNALVKLLTEEGAKEPDEQIRSMSNRPATIWADGRTPYGLVLEVGVACEEAGLYKAICDGPTSPLAPPVPNPGAPANPPKEEEKTPFSVRIGARRKEGALELQIGKGAWIAAERQAMEHLRATKAISDTDLLLDPDPEVPWAAVLRLTDLLETWGFVEFAHLAPCFPLEVPIASTAVSEAEALQFARKLDQSFKEGDSAAFDRALHREELIRRTIGTRRLGVAMRINVKKMIDGSVPTEFEARGTPALRFLTMDTADGKPWPRFRLLTPNRHDYWSFVLAKAADGTVRIVDLYSMASGENVSESIHASFLNDSDALELLNVLRGGTPRDLALCLGKKAAPMMDFLMEGQPKEALQYFAENVEALKSSKAVQRLRLNIARQVGLAEYAKALEEFERDLPSDPAHVFLRVERHLVMGDREKGLLAIEALDRAVKGDSFLNVMRAQLQLVAGDFAKGQTLAEKATAEEPTLDRGWVMWLTASLGQKDYAKASSVLSAAEKALKTKLQNLEGLPNHEEWMKSRK